MLYIGESINGTIPAVNQAILKHDADFILKLAVSQVECGADYLDVNAGTGGIGNERDDLRWLIELLQDNVECPLCLDSSEPEILMEIYKNYRGKPMFNSVCEGKKLDIMAPAISEQECSVIALAHGKTGFRTMRNCALFLQRKLSRDSGMQMSKIVIFILIRLSPIQRLER